MTKKEAKEIENLITKMIKKDLSCVLQRLVDKRARFEIGNEEAFMQELEDISKEYELKYIERRD